jgi:hypothetical protein
MGCNPNVDLGDVPQRSATNCQREPGQFAIKHGLDKVGIIRGQDFTRDLRTGALLLLFLGDVVFQSYAGWTEDT